MEDTQEKLDLMMDCYLGKWHPIYGDEIQVNSFGIGNAFFGIAGYGQNLTQGINPEKCVEKLREFYGWIAEEYSHFPIDQLDESDNDFHTVLVTHRLLPRLERVIERLIEEPSQERFKDLVKLRDEWYEADNPSYTERIVALCSRMKSEPTILQK